MYKGILGTLYVERYIYIHTSINNKKEDNDDSFDTATYMKYIAFET